jgi:hypothetical protein
MKLDFTKLVLIPSGGSGGFSSDFDVSAKDFLRYAKEDLHSGGDRATINALSNAKRAIDCQIDEVFHSLGLDFQNLPKALEPFVSFYKFKNDLPYKLKIIQSLNLAPAFIVSKARSIRNKLEHFYKIPSLNEVEESIDIADLFIRCIDGKLKIPTNEFYISDEHNRIKNDYYGIKKGYSVDISLRNKTIEIREIQDEKWGEEVSVTKDDSEFYALVRIMNSMDDDYEVLDSFKLLAHLIQYPTPIKHIQVQQH